MFSSDSEAFHDESDLTFDESSDSVALIHAVQRNRQTMNQEAQGGKAQELMFALENFKRDNLHLREQITQLKAREMEMTAMMVSTQDRWNGMKNQITTMKLSLQSQLQSPISEEEYYKIEQRTEEDRDLVDAVKLGVYRQIGVLKASRDSAVKAGSERAVQVESLEKKLAAAESQLREKIDGHHHQKEQLQGKVDDLEAQVAQVAPLQARLNDAEHRLQIVRNDREQYYDTKMQLAAKSNDAMRSELAVKELEDKLAAARTEADCTNEKLDILKSEYYESKLQHTQRILELESQLRATEEKMSMLRDLELEADIFMSNIAESTSTAADGTTVALPFDVPASRRLQHSLSVTKRALLLENQVVALKHELQVSRANETKLADSLKMTKAILSDEGHPYSLVEDALQSKEEEIRLLNDHITSLQAENVALDDKVRGLTADVATLTRHRRELGAMKQALQQLPFPGSSPKQQGRGQVAWDQQRPQSTTSPLLATSGGTSSSSAVAAPPAEEQQYALPAALSSSSSAKPAGLIDTSDIHMPAEPIIIC